MSRREMEKNREERRKEIASATEVRIELEDKLATVSCCCCCCCCCCCYYYLLLRLKEK